MKKELKASEAEGVTKGLALPLLPSSRADAQRAANTSLAIKTTTPNDV